MRWRSRSPAISNMRPAASAARCITGMELLKLIAKIDLLHVPFRGAGPGGIDVIAGNTKAMMATASSVDGSHPRRQAARPCDQHGQAHQGVARRADLQRGGAARVQGWQLDRFFGSGRNAEADHRAASQGDFGDPGHAGDPAAVREPRRLHREDDFGTVQRSSSKARQPSGAGWSRRPTSRRNSRCGAISPRSDRTDLMSAR